LLLRDRFDGSNLISVSGRHLVGQLFGSDQHSVGKLFDEFGMPTVEEERNSSNVVFIVLAGNLEDTGARTPPDLVLKAGTYSRSEFGVGAGSELEVAVDEAQGFPSGRCRMVGAKVTRSVRAWAADNLKARPLSLRIKSQREELLIVPELDVISGAMLFDQLILKERGLLFTVDDEGLDIVELGRKKPDEVAHITRARLEVTSHPTPQVPRLSDVEYEPSYPSKEIDAGAGGEPVELGDDGVREHRNGSEPDLTQGTPATLRY